ncbi:MAG TPA: hypothetical protein VK668_16950 [Mucilaginibacter sp.]|nr:hypothetical protein [Mucilaginibacter sp.]
MISIKNEAKKTGIDKLVSNLATEGPLCEKDEQGRAIERTKLLQKEALEKWERLTREKGRTGKK